MNPALMLAFWRQRLTSPIRLALLAGIAGLPLLGVAFMRGAGLSVLGDSQGPVLVLGAGMIGQDVSSGVLQLLFARPVRRPDYVVSRWLSVAIAASAIAVLQLMVALPLMAARNGMPGTQEVLFYASGRVLESFGLAAVLALLSSLVPGIGDLALYLLFNMMAGIIQTAGRMKEWIWVDRLGGELIASLQPTVDVGQLLHASPLPWYPIVAYASTLTLCLAVAIVVVNRRELSYASAG